MPRSAYPILAAALILMSSAALADPAGDALRDKVAKAYQDTTVYAARIDFRVEEKRGRWLSTNSTWFKVAFEKPNKLVIDRPEFLLVADGNSTRVRISGYDSRHVQQPAEPTISMKSLSSTLTLPGMGALLDQPMMFMPDATLLLSANPFDAFTAKQKADTAALEPDGDGRPGLKLTTDRGTWTLRVDPTSHLIVEAVRENATKKDDGDYARMVYRFKIETHNDKHAPDTFALDTGKSQAVDTIEQLISGDVGDAPANADAQAAHPIEGKTPPNVALQTLDGKDYDLAKDKAEVIVFDFWTTWCPPCRAGLPELQKVYDWAKKNKKSVAIYTINLEEKAATVEKFWKERKLTMPVLMDTKGKISNAYFVTGIPQTVIIHGGKVAHVHVGLLPDTAKTLTEQIEELLKNKAN